MGVFYYVQAARPSAMNMNTRPRHARPGEPQAHRREFSETPWLSQSVGRGHKTSKATVMPVMSHVLPIS